MNRTPARVTICSIIALLLAGCVSVGPDYSPPEPPVQNHWSHDANPDLDTVGAVSPDWWKGALKDPVLDNLVNIALQDNLDLLSAGLRVLQFQQRLAIAVGKQYPQTQQATGSAGVERRTGRSYDVYDVGLDISWEVDVWGRFRRQVASASAALDASLANYDSVMVSIIAQVAQSYILIRTTQRRLEVAQQNVARQEQNYAIAQAKFDAGGTSALDMEQALTLLYGTKATIYDLEVTLQQLQNALAVLLGRSSQDLQELLGEPRPIPKVEAAVSVGMPQDLIRRRPDIRIAERRLAAQSEQIGVAITELYPQFVIGGSIGTEVSTLGPYDAGDLFSSDTNFYNAGIGFRWNLFNYGRLRSNVRLQDAAFQQLLEDYRQTVLQAQAETDSAIVAFLKSHSQLQDIRSGTEAASRAVDISTEQYQDGLVNFNTVISTLNTLASQQDQLAAAEGTTATNLVDVYRALGGGWQLRTNGDPVDLLPEETRQQMQNRTGYWKDIFEE